MNKFLIYGYSTLILIFLMFIGLVYKAKTFTIIVMFLAIIFTVLTLKNINIKGN